MARLALTATKSLLLLGETLDPGDDPDAVARQAERLASDRFRVDMHGVSYGDFAARVRRLMASPDRSASNLFLFLYRELLDALDLRLVWREAGPEVAIDRIEPWLDILNDFDESVLLSFDAAEAQPPTSAAPALPEWGIVARIDDFALERLLAPGAHDLHVHLGGVRQSSVAWARAMAATDGWKDYRALAEQFQLVVGCDWPDVARQAREDRCILARAFGREAPSLRAVWRDPDPRALLAEERRLLYAGFLRLRRAEAGLATPSGTTDVETSFRRYVHARNQFQRCTRQPAFTATPGLARFDGTYFRVTKTNDRSPRGSRQMAPSARFRANRAFATADETAAARVLADDPCLTHVELRLAPRDRAVDYHVFLDRWAEIEHKLNQEREAEGRSSLPGVHFAIHFVRTRRMDERRASLRRGRRRVPRAPEEIWDDFHRDIGRQTAVLHRALTDPAARRRDLMRRIARVDVAGQERDTPIEMFAPHLRLLRGDRRALDALDALVFRDGLEGGEGDDVFSNAAEWRRMTRNGNHRPLPHPSPALTVHAGEDYADPLEGIFQVWAAVETCGLQSGEGIGHALALAPPADPSEARAAWCRADGQLTPLQNWASLAWLQRLTRNCGWEEREPAAYHRLGELLRAADEQGLNTVRSEHAIDRDFSALYVPTGRHMPSLTRDHWCAFAGIGDALEASSRADLFSLVELARVWLLRLVIERGIVIEGNPSSNLRVSGVASLADLPTVALLEQVSHGLQLCVNTDNPGTFAAALRNEYALLLQGGRTRGLDERILRDALSTAMDVGRYGVRMRGVR